MNTAKLMIALGAIMFMSACDQRSGFDSGFASGVMYEMDGSADMRTVCEIAGNVVVNVDMDEDGYGGYEGCAQPNETWPFVVSNLKGDCNDENAAVHPNAVEVCANSVNENCVNGADEQPCVVAVTTCASDVDNDGYTAGGTIASADGDCSDLGEALFTEPAGDCNDTDPDVHPNATEVCNDIDDDCDADGRADEAIGMSSFYRDADGDTYGNPLITLQDCAQPTGYVQNNRDCNDAQASARPGGTEVPGNGIDEDCDGLGDDSVSGTCFADADNDQWRTGNTVTNNDTDCDDPGEAYSTEQSGDCNDTSVSINPGAVDSTVDGVDQDCDNVDGNDGTVVCYADGDNDGYRNGTVITNNDTDCSDPGEASASEPSGDCNDNSNTVYPGAPDTVGDGVDQDCSGADGTGTTGTTCYMDTDNDNVRTSNTVQSADADCNDSGEANLTELSGDCNDLDPAVLPGATEIVGDSIDQNCDSVEVCYADGDNDNFRSSVTTATIVSVNDTNCYGANEAAMSEAAVDCNDAIPTIRPGAVETCNSVDDDCDGGVDEGVSMTTWYPDADADGAGNSALGLLACSQPSGRVSTGGDCNDGNNAIRPGVAEIPGDSVDQDCNGAEVCYTDGDNDGHRPNSTSTTNSVDTDCGDQNEAVSTDPTMDCNDGSNTVYPGATEIPGNNLDEDCNGSDLTTGVLYYRDQDGDTYGAMNGDVKSVPTPGYILRSGDCNDTNSNIFPGAPDPIDGIDQDCSDSVGTSTRTTNVWTFTLDSTATALSLDQFEVKNVTNGNARVSTTNRSGSTVTITLTTKPGDVLEIQCWLAGNNQWCAANGHSGHIVSATGPTGSYSVGQLTGDMKYVSNGSGGYNYGGSVK